jgi:peptidoglycan/LPS O-acetylase OafA/YrhL
VKVEKSFTRHTRQLTHAVSASILVVIPFGAAVADACIQTPESLWVFVPFALCLLPGLIVTVLLPRSEKGDSVTWADRDRSRLGGQDRHAEARRRLVLGCGFLVLGAGILIPALVILMVPRTSAAWIVGASIAAAMTTVAVLVWEVRATRITDAGRPD